MARSSLVLVVGLLLSASFAAQAKTPPKGAGPIKPAWMETCTRKAAPPILVFACEQLSIAVFPVGENDPDEALKQAVDFNRKKALEADPKASQAKVASYLPGLKAQGARQLWTQDGQRLFFDSFGTREAVFQCGGPHDKAHQKRCKEALGYIKRAGLKVSDESIAPISELPLPEIEVPPGCEKQKVPPPVHVWLCRESTMTELTLIPLDKDKKNARQATESMVPMADQMLKKQGWATQDPRTTPCTVGGEKAQCELIRARKPSGAKAFVLVGAGQVKGLGRASAICKWEGAEGKPPKICQGVMRPAR